MENRLDPSGAALYAIIAICLVLVGGVLTVTSLSLEQRGTILGGIFAALAFVAWRWHRRKGGDDSE